VCADTGSNEASFIRELVLALMGFFCAKNTRCVNMTERAENFVTKLDQVRKLIVMRLPSMNVQNLAERMSKLAHYHYNKRKFLLVGEDRELYNLLVESSYNPFTVYRWLLLERVPEGVKWQLKNRQVSQKRAIKLCLERRRETGSSLAAEIKALGMKLIGGM
jgi:hypothetical protein